MKTAKALAGLCAAGLLLAGCRTATHTARPPTNIIAPQEKTGESKPAPQAVPKGAEQKRLQDRIGSLEQGIAEQRKLQMRLSNELDRAWVELQASQAEFQRLQARSRGTAQKLASHEVALNAIKEDWGRQHSGGVAAPWVTVSNLQATLIEERRRADAQRLALQQRDREIRDLQNALSAQVVLKNPSDTPAGSASAVEPAASDPATPANPGAVDVAALTGLSAPGPAGAVNTEAAADSAPDTASMDANSALYIPADQLATEGNRLLHEGHSEEAERLFATALSRDPGSVSARQGLATCRYLAADFAEALRLATEVLKTDPRNAQAPGLAGISAWRQGDLKTATRMLETAVKRDEDNAQWHIYLGIVYYAEQKESPALRELRKAVELNPNLAEARFNLAIVLAVAHPPKLEEARQNYQASLRLGNPRDEKIEKMLYP